jgi:hypothetical protein
VDGVIVPMDTEGCADGIVRLLRNPEKMQQLEKNCGRKDYSNLKAADKLMLLI